jgi:hypothetical protein
VYRFGDTASFLKIECPVRGRASSPDFFRSLFWLHSFLRMDKELRTCYFDRLLFAII